MEACCWCFIAAICHDLHHNDFKDVNEKNNLLSPLGLLFKKQSVYEVGHCEVMIDILSNEKCDILCGFNETDSNSILRMITQLILSTDMGMHNKIFKECMVKSKLNQMNNDFEWY